MQLIEVTSNELERLFLELPQTFYKNDPQYIRPLNNDITKVFDLSQNTLLTNGQCKRWIVKDEKNVAVGRIAAFINPLTFHSSDLKVGGIGFFECSNNFDAAKTLFDASVEWLKTNGAEAVDGPINFGSRERWWGLLTEGFHQPCYCCNYNPPYYNNLFEQYGFKTYFRQYTYIRRIRDPLKPVLLSIAERVSKNTDYSFNHIRLNNLPKYAEDFRSIYNKAWINHESVEPITKEQAAQMVSGLKPVIDEKLIWFAYYKGNPIGFFICIPELNELFVKYVDGKLDTFGKLRLLYNKWRKSTKTVFGLVFGIVPEQQRKGVEIALIVHAAKEMSEKTDYKEIQMNWIGDFNPKMMHLAEQIGAKIYKTHQTYRYLFDRSKEFVRHPSI